MRLTIAETQPPRILIHIHNDTQTVNHRHGVCVPRLCSAVQSLTT
jgi:hypothetical protein